MGGSQTGQQPGVLPLVDLSAAENLVEEEFGRTRIDMGGASRIENSVA